MKTNKPKLNVRLLRRIKQHILEEPRRFFMEGVAQTGTPGEEFSELDRLLFPDLPLIVPPCGTAACIHGWTAILSGKTPKQAQRLTFTWSERKLGIRKETDWQHSLFYSHDWPKPFASRYEKAKTSEQRAKIAADRIEHLITTGE